MVTNLTAKPSNVRYKNPLIFGLTILLVISVGLNLSQNKWRQTEDISKQLETIKSLSGLRTLTIQSPVTRYLEGNRIVSGYCLHFQRNEYIRSTEDDIAFYVPIDNSTLELKFYLSLDEGYSQGLFLQKGNAYRNESGVLIRGNPEDQRIIVDKAGTHIYNATIWQSPVIWEKEAINGERYIVLLESSGWYTLSLWSPILSTVGSLEKSGQTILMDKDSTPSPSHIDSWVEFRVMGDKEPMLFIVRNN